ncbi:glycosyltransferase [Pediococcus acidilactici]|uniref:glycosyltransferase n=1 Tax=Pediococcus acidilactici TaxID=1254 RepID=UPI001F4FCB02|nr:glycosyltransferase [Pediococcus acidilactici]
MNSNVKLILIGSGPLEEKIDNKIKRLNLQNKVIKVKWTESVDKFYSAFDEVIFPSLYEGFPLSLIEAQSTGCPVIFSNSITKKVKIINSIISCSLGKGSKFWAKRALENLENSTSNRIDAYKILLNQSFDYSSYNKKMIDLYCKV